MNRFYSYIGILLLSLAALCACAGRSEVISEMNRYEPPPVYRASGPPDSSAPAPSGPAAPHPETDPQPNLTALKEKGEREITAPPPESLFYTPNATRREALLPALSDDAACEAALAGGFSLETLEILAWGRNPQVASAEQTLRATVEAYSQAAELEEVLRQYGAFSAGSMTGVGAMTDIEGIDKKYPFPGIPALKGKIVTEEVRIASEELEIARRSAVTDARKAYWALRYADAAVDIITASLSITKTLEASIARRYETGNASARNLSAVSVQRQTLAEELLTMTAERQNRESDIRAIIDLPETAKIGPPRETAGEKALPSPESLRVLAIQRRQELRKKRAMIARMEFMIEMAETEIYPGFTQNRSLSENRAVTRAGTSRMTDASAVTPETGVGAPKDSFYGLSEAYLRETRQKLSALRKELSGDEADTRARVREAWSSADRAGRLYRLFKDRISSLSELDVASAAKLVESGAMPFSDLLETTAVFFETRLSIEKNRSDLGRAMAELKEITGVSW